MLILLYIRIRKGADIAIAYLRVRAFELYPKSQTNNNETYADMTTRLLRNSKASMKVIPVGIYWLL